jgi:hypothetical protein
MFLKALNPSFDLNNPQESDTEVSGWLGKDVRVNVIKKEDAKGVIRNKIADIQPVGNKKKPKKSDAPTDPL